MIENSLKKLIGLNERIANQNDILIKQNDEIIGLLKQLNGEVEDISSSEEISIDLGNGILFNEMGQVSNDGLIFEDNLRNEIPEDENLVLNKKDNLIFDGSLNPGEVMFVGNSEDGSVDIYKLTVKNSDELKVSPSEITEEITQNFDDVNYEITIDNLTGDGITYQFKIPLLVAFESLDKDAAINSSTAILDDEVFMNLPEMLRVAMEDGAEKIYLPMKNAISTLGAPQALLNHLEFYKTTDQILDKLF